MSYLEKLIERATDTNLDLENNQIGSYRITPQHGLDLAIYHIYKDNCRPHYSRGRKFNNQHVCTIEIFDNKVRCRVNDDYLVQREVNNIMNVLNNLYSTFDIKIINFEN
jgi:hypothetical protein